MFKMILMYIKKGRIETWWEQCGKQHYAYRENPVLLSFWHHVQLFFFPKSYVLKANFQWNKSNNINENLKFPNIQNVEKIG